jgi:formylglycine-generating enzyme required for sulfatase activity
VVFVSHTDARRYAEWVDARLLGSLGWEKAVRGPSGSPTPWKGTRRPAKHANLWDPEREEARSPAAWEEHLEEAGLRPDGASPFGILDGAGNVREWCGDKPESFRSWDRVLRYRVSGSSWQTSSQHPLLSVESVEWEIRAGDLGFRLGRPLSAMVQSIDELDLQGR